MPRVPVIKHSFITSCQNAIPLYRQWQTERPRIYMHPRHARFSLYPQSSETTLSYFSGHPTNRRTRGSTFGAGLVRFSSGDSLLPRQNPVTDREAAGPRRWGESHVA